MGDNTSAPIIVVKNWKRACAVCGHRWRWKMLVAKDEERPSHAILRKEGGRCVVRSISPAWEGGGIAVCCMCLERLRRCVMRGEEPEDSVERLVLYCVIGYDAIRGRRGIAKRVGKTG